MFLILGIPCPVKSRTATQNSNYMHEKSYAFFRMNGKDGSISGKLMLRKLCVVWSG